MRPRIRSHLLGPYEEWLEARWQSGYQVGQQLWQELKELGYKGSRNTVARWAAKRRAGHNPQAPDRQQTRAAWKAPSRRRCAWYLSQAPRSEEHTSELQSLMRISYAVFCLKKKKQTMHITSHNGSERNDRRDPQANLAGTHQ